MLSVTASIHKLEVKRDLNQSSWQIWGGLTLTAWLFRSLSAPFPFSVCQQRLCPLLSHGTALESWEKRGKATSLPSSAAMETTNDEDINAVIRRVTLWAASHCTLFSFFLRFLCPPLFHPFICATLVPFYHGPSDYCDSYTNKIILNHRLIIYLFLCLNVNSLFCHKKCEKV